MMDEYVWRLKYDPKQPRVPAGRSGGGRWTSGGSAGRRVPSDAVEFSGTLYHSTSPQAAESIQREGFSFPEGARQRDAVYFGRKPLAAGQQGGAVVQVDLENAQLAPTSDRLMEIATLVRSEVRSRTREAPRSERWNLRDKYDNDDYIYQEARQRFTDEGYDGYEQGWEVVAITNLDMLNAAVIHG